MKSPHAAQAMAPTSASWPPERFYWALLAAPPGAEPRSVGGVMKGDAGEVPAGLLADLAEQLPVSLDDVQAVCVRTRGGGGGGGGADGGGGLLVCAARREELAALPPETMRLTPREIPAIFAAATAGDRANRMGIEGGATRLNLLVGGFEPRSRRRRRARRHVAGLVISFLVGGLLMTGFIRRTAYWDRAAEDARLRADRLVAAALPPGLPPQALPAEVARLQHASLATAQVQPPPDAALALAALLDAWPRGVAGVPQSLAVTEGGITVSVLIDGIEEADADPAHAFLAAFTPPQGWNMEEPRLNSGPGFVRIVIDLKAAPPAAVGPSGGDGGRNP